MQTIKDIPIKGFIETSFVDWAGKICAVLFFPRCNFRCSYCHNADLVLRPDNFENIGPETVFARLAEMKGWIDGVCITGGEPTLHRELPRLLQLIRDAGFQTKLDTNGSNPEVLRQLIEQQQLDYVAMDVKSCLDESSYCKVINVPGNMMRAVRESIALLLDGNVEYEFRVTVVPSYHGPEDIYQLARDLKGAACLRLQNFNPGAPILDPALKSIVPYTEEVLYTLQQRVDELLAVGDPPPPRRMPFASPPVIKP